jgi:hypothetical protein
MRRFLIYFYFVCISVWYRGMFGTAQERWKQNEKNDDMNVGVSSDAE